MLAWLGVVNLVRVPESKPVPCFCKWMVNPTCAKMLEIMPIDVGKLFKIRSDFGLGNAKTRRAEIDQSTDAAIDVVARTQAMRDLFQIMLVCSYIEKSAD